MSYGKSYCTAVGTFADSCGIIQRITDEVARDSRGQVLSVTRHRELEHDPASKYATFQPSAIPILWRHKGAPIGRCVLLDRRNGRLAAVAVLEEKAEFFTDRMPELFWSSGTRDDGELTLTEISLTPSPATNGLPPVKFFDGLPADAKGRSGAPWAMLNTAAEVLKGVYNPMEVRCAFDDFDRPLHEARFARSGKSWDRGDGMIYIQTAPIGQVLSVNGRPVGPR